ncbi:Leucine-rich repeat and calponin y domain-containing protein 1 [Merluccius polli]|uniref:Leucine-rich repeat and calponin y domain-containing protein 1 n=1 Tax=Merluccius polli TaxID=89951 RepID=A0AA47NVK6_MERPO|nr:Leucine-rich repeat and calponin y domain-containing protein 1 [Merluccius polli]
MAMLGPESVRPHSQLGGGGGGGGPPPAAAAAAQTGGGLGAMGLHPPPPNRASERALEEAAGGGVLNLSARKLKEFPRSAAAHDLTDTVEADLSKNRLTEVPSEICHLVALETLNLYHNCIRTIPDNIISLQALTSLNLSRNQLSVLPACLSRLPLRVLNASNNKLVSLPDAIAQLHHLMELDVSCNELSTLPRHIGRLKALRELNVRRNLLCVLPEDLSELPLVKFDVSCNKVSTLPLSFRNMKQLQTLRLDHNPLQSPPAQICIKGRVHIFKYLSMEACRSDKMPDALFLPVIERLSLSQPSTGSSEDVDHHRKQDADSGVGSDNGDKRLSATEPSDEESLSLTVAMTNITEEGISQQDSSEHINTLTADCEAVQLIEESPTEALREQSKVTGGTELHIDMINQLKEAVELLQDPNRGSLEQDGVSGVQLYPVEMVTVDDSLNGQESDDGSTTPKLPAAEACEFQQKRQMILEKAHFEAQLACRQYEWHMSIKEGEMGSPSCERMMFSTPPFGLKPRSAPSSLPCSPPPSCLRPLLSQAPPSRRDTPRSHDDGGMTSCVFLRSHKSLEAVDPQFTMRRKMEQLREELELLETLRDGIEGRLKVALPEDLGSSLMDGVVLCHLANHIRPRSVASIHVPSPAVPKLSMAKCRRNVENFLDACRKIGVSESSLCSPYDIIQCRLRPLRSTVQALVALETTPPSRPGDTKQNNVAARKPSREPSSSSAPRSKNTPSLVCATTQTPPPAWQMWDLIGSSLMHVFCLVLLFDKLCLPHHILEERGLLRVCTTVQALLDHNPTKQTLLT